VASTPRWSGTRESTGSARIAAARRRAIDRVTTRSSTAAGEHRHIQMWLLHTRRLGWRPARDLTVAIAYAPSGAGRRPGRSRRKATKRTRTVAGVVDGESRSSDVGFRLCHVSTSASRPGHCRRVGARAGDTMRLGCVRPAGRRRAVRPRQDRLQRERTTVCDGLLSVPAWVSHRAILHRRAARHGRAARCSNAKPSAHSPAESRPTKWEISRCARRSAASTGRWGRRQQVGRQGKDICVTSRCVNARIEQRKVNM